eukprot:g13635.t1
MANSSFKPPVRKESVPPAPPSRKSGSKPPNIVLPKHTARESVGTSPSGAPITPHLHGSHAKSLPGHRASGSRMSLVSSGPHYFPPNKEAKLGDAIAAWEAVSGDKSQTNFAIFKWSKRFEKLDVYQTGGHADDSSHHECMLYSAELCEKSEPHWCGYTVRAVHNDSAGQKHSEMVPVAFFVIPPTASPNAVEQCKLLKNRIRNTVFANTAVYFDHMAEAINMVDEAYVEFLFRRMWSAFFARHRRSAQDTHLDFGGGHKYTTGAPWFGKSQEQEIAEKAAEKQRRLSQRVVKHEMDEEKNRRVSENIAWEQKDEATRAQMRETARLALDAEQKRRVAEQQKDPKSPQAMVGKLVAYKKEHATTKDAPKRASTAQMFDAAAHPVAIMVKEAHNDPDFAQAMEERERRASKVLAKELAEQELQMRISEWNAKDKLVKEHRDNVAKIAMKVLDSEQARRSSETALQENYERACKAKMLTHTILDELHAKAEEMDRKTSLRYGKDLTDTEHARRLADLPLPSKDHVAAMGGVLTALKQSVRLHQSRQGTAIMAN